MSSSYSPLKIELQVTGENALQWGNITNNNLTALEDASHGTVDLVFAGANYPPLTVANTNSPQAARYFRLHCIGDLGNATRSLTLPPLPPAGQPVFRKFYVVHNDCATGPANINVRGPAAGATVDVPPFRHALLYYDGTNVVSASSHIPNLTVNDLGVAGTFTAGTVSATSLIAGSGGVTTAGTVTIQRGAQLHIDSADGSGTPILYSPTNDFRFWIAGDRMTIAANGYVGIGRAPGTMLDVEGTGRLFGLLDIRAYAGGDATLRYLDGGATIEYGHIAAFYPGHMRYQAQSGGVHYFVAGGSERLRITAGGWVGIGTTSPDQMLHVTGNIHCATFYGGSEGLSGTAPIHITGNSNYAATAGSASSAGYATSAANLGGGVFYGSMTWETNVYFYTRPSGNNQYRVTTGATWGVVDDPANNWVVRCTAGAQVVIGEAGSRGLKIVGNGWTNGSHQVDGNITCSNSITANDNITAYSDRRLKTNLAPITNALDKVCVLNGYTYDRIDDPEGRRRVGLIAQEVQGVLPEAVLDMDGTLALDYGNMVALLVEAIKELKEEVAYLKGYGK